MSYLKTLYLITTFCFISGCFAPKDSVGALKRYDFNYTVSNQRRNGIVQVFNDETKTYVQFFPGYLEGDDLEVTTLEGRKVTLLCHRKRFCGGDFIQNDFFIRGKEISSLVKKVVADESTKSGADDAN